MCRFELEPGAALLYPSGPDGDYRRNHLFVVMTSPSGPGRQIIMVPVCTVRPKCDRTCILSANDHDFLTHESFVAYRFTRLEREERLLRGIDSGEFVQQPPVVAEIYADIRAGFDRSPFVAPYVLDFLSQYNF